MLRPHQKSLRVLLAVMAGGVAVACGTARPGRMTRTNPQLISPAELDAARQDGIRDLHELIDRTRPRWLQIRSPRSLALPTVIAVYHHEVRLGGVDALRGYPLLSVTSVRYLDAAQAMLLPGAGSAHVEGAIVISTLPEPGRRPAR